jgi:hypothetical protein
VKKNTEKAHSDGIFLIAILEKSMLEAERYNPIPVSSKPHPKRSVS